MRDGERIGGWLAAATNQQGSISAGIEIVTGAGTDVAQRKTAFETTCLEGC